MKRMRVIVDLQTDQRGTDVLQWFYTAMDADQHSPDPMPVIEVIEEPETIPTQVSNPRRVSAGGR